MPSSGPAAGAAAVGAALTQPAAEPVWSSFSQPTVHWCSTPDESSVQPHTDGSASATLSSIHA